MRRLSKKDLLILLQLRRNARESLTCISKKTGIPVSTIFDKLKGNVNRFVTKHTSLLDFGQLGYGTRIHLVLRVKKEDREEAKHYLMRSPYVNSAYRVNNGYHYLVEAVLRDLPHVESFLDEMESCFKIEEKKIFYIVDELKKEAFLENNEIVLASF